MGEARENREIGERAGNVIAAERKSGIGFAGRLAAVLIVLLGGFGLMTTTAQAAKIDNPSPPNFKGQVTGGFLQLVGGSGTVLQLSLDFASFDPPLAKPTFEGTITRDANGYGTINVPAANINFAPIPINVSGIAVIIRIQAAGAATGKIDPLSGRTDFRVPLKLKAEGNPLGISLGGNCYIGSDGDPVVLNTTTHYGTFPSVTSAGPGGRSGVYVADFVSDGGGFAGGILPAGPYSDEAGEWPLEPKVNGIGYQFVARSAGSWRGQDETLRAPAATNCGLATGTLNDQIGLPTNAGASSASLDFQFIEIPGVRTGSNAIVQKAVKSIFFSPETSGPVWDPLEKPTLVSGQDITVDASNSRFTAGGNAAERYRFDFGSGFGPWTTNPIANYTGPIIPNGTEQTVTVKVEVKDVDGDTDTNTRLLRLIPATDIQLTANASSVAGPKLRAGSSGTVQLNVKNSSTTDNSSLPIRLQASLPTGLTLTNLQKPNNNWNCSSTASSIDCSLAAALLGPNTTDAFNLSVDVSTGAPAPAPIPIEAVMTGDPDTSNDRSTFQAPVVKTDLALDLTRTSGLVANGWTPYEIDVANLGDGVTVGGSSVVVSLPEGFAYRAAGSGGTGWNCPAPSDPREITCNRSAELAGNSSAPKLTVVARIDRTTAAGSKTVSASVTTQGDVGAFGGSNSDSDTASVQVLPDLTSDVSVSGDYKVGDPGTATVTVTNESVISNSGDTVVSGSLPTGVTMTSASGTGWDCSATAPGDSAFSCTRTAILTAAQTTPAINLTFAVAQPAYPGVTIGATVTNSSDGFSPNDSDSVEVRVRRLDVRVEKQAIKPFNVGVEGRYRINVRNVGDASTVGEIVVTDTLPTGIRLKAVSGGGWNCSSSITGSQNVRCVFPGVLEADIQAAPIDIRVDVLDAAAEAGIVTNTAFVDTARDDRSVPADSAITANNTSTIETPAVAVDLAIESQHPGVFRVGTEDTYSLTVRNVGAFATDPGQAVTVTDEIPDGMFPNMAGIEISRPGWICDDVDGDVVCTLDAPSPSTPAMATGGTVTIDIPVFVSDAAADDSENIALVSTTRDSNPDLSPNNRSADETAVARIDLELEATESITPRAGSIGEITVDLSNIGTAATVEPAVVTMSLAAGTSYRPSGSTTTGWSCISAGAGTIVTCTRLQSIAAGADAPPLKIRTDVAPGTAGVLGWTTVVDSATLGEPDERTANNDVSIEQDREWVDLTVSKTHDAAKAKAGKRTKFEIVVNNNGNVGTSGTIRVQDTVNSAFENVQASGPGWNCSVTGRAVSCVRTASIPGGQSSPPIAVAFDIPTDAFGQRDSIATVTHSGDPYPSNNSATNPITVITGADVEVAIDQPGLVRVGDVVSVGYQVTNVGSDATSGSPAATMRISLLPNLEPVRATSVDGWSCDAYPAAGSEGAYFECELATELGMGETSELQAEVRVLPTDEPTTRTAAYTNTAGDLNILNNGAEVESAVNGLDLSTSVEAPAGEEIMTAGTVARRVVSIVNVGTSPTVGNITVDLPLPIGVQWQDSGSAAYGTGWDCRQIVRTVRCERSDQFGPDTTLPNLNIDLIASKANAPAVDLEFTTTTPEDQNQSNDTAFRTDSVIFEPSTTVTSGPSGTVTSRAATIVFTSDDPAASFECSIDAGEFEFCASPVNLTGLADGAHVFLVRALNEDSGLIDQTPAEARWSVAPEPPAGDKQRIKATLLGGNLILPGLADDGAPFEGGQLRLVGDLYENGGLVVPAAGVEFDPLVIEQTVPGVGALTASIAISATGPGAGTLTPGGGPASFQLPVKAQVVVETAIPGFSIPPEANCNLSPIQFDLNGTYDEAGKTISLGSEALSFPAAPLDTCGPLAGALNGLAGLPRDDITLSLDFSLEDLPNPDPAQLAAPKITAPKTVRSGKMIEMRTQLRNTGDGVASGVRVCVKGPATIVRGPAVRCQTVGSIAAGGTKSVSFELPTRASAKGKKASFVVSAEYVVDGTKKYTKTGHVTVLK